MDESLFLVRWIIDKIHKNVKKKSKSESLAALEESLFEAEKSGNKKAQDAIKAIIKTIKKRK